MEVDFITFAKQWYESEKNGKQKEKNGEYHQISFLEYSAYCWLKQEEETQQLIQDNMKLVYRVIHDLNLSHRVSDYEDIGMISLCEAVKSFNPNVGAPLSSYIYICVKRAILHEREKESKRKLINTNTFDYLDEDFDIDYCPAMEDKKQNTEQSVTNSEMLDYIVELLSNEAYFTPKQKDIFIKYHGINCVKWSIQELADEYGISSSGIVTNQVRTFKKLQSLIKD